MSEIESYDIQVGTKFEILNLMYPMSHFETDCRKMCGNDLLIAKIQQYKLNHQIVSKQNIGERLQKTALANKGLIFVGPTNFLLVASFFVFPIA